MLAGKLYFKKKDKQNNGIFFYTQFMMKKKIKYIILLFTCYLSKKGYVSILKVIINAPKITFNALLTNNIRKINVI